MRRMLDFVFRSVVRNGSLTVVYSDRTRAHYGDGAPPHVAIRLTSPTAERRIALNPELALGEAYTDGHLLVEKGSIYGLLDLVMRMPAWSRLPAWVPVRATARFVRRRIAQFNPTRRAKRNVAHHYDLGGRLYSLFLDSDRQYSCA